MFAGVFGPKAQRKRPNVAFSDMQAMVESAEGKVGDYSVEKDKDLGML